MPSRFLLAKHSHFIFQKPVQVQIQVLQVKLPLLKKNDNTYSWTVNSPKTATTVTNTVQEINYDCSELKENKEYMLSIFSEVFRLEESGNPYFDNVRKFSK